MRTSTVVLSGGGEAPGSKRMRAICVAGRARYQLLLRPGIDTGNRQDLRDRSGNAPVAEQHKDHLSDLGIDQTFVGNVPVDEDVGWIEDFGDRRACRQRLADIREACRDYPANRRKDLALAEMALHLIKMPS